MKSTEQILPKGSVNEELIVLREENERLRQKLSVSLGRNPQKHLLAESETRYRNFIESSHDLIQSVNADGSFDFVNTAWLECLGYEEEEIQDLNFIDIIHESSQSHCMSLFEKIIMGADIDVVEATFCKKSGEPVEVSGEIRVRRVDGKVIATHGVFRDVTDEIAVQEDLLKKKLFLQLSQEISKTGSWRRNIVSGDLEWSDNYFNIFGYDPETTTAHLDLFWKHVHPEDLEVVQDLFQRLPDSDETLNCEFRIIDGHGEIKHLLSYTLSVKTENGGIELVGAFLDISSVRARDRELLKTLHDLKISNEELEQFAYVASHDLQEPIRLINTYASMLDEKLAGQLDESTARYMGFIQESSTRMRDLVKGLLDFSLVGNHKMQRETINLGELIEPILLNFTKEINDYNTEIVLNDLPDVYCDKLQVSRLMQNLLGNAVKFSRNVSGPKIVIDASENSAEFVISIKDNGIGVKDENLEKIFTIFKRLNSKELFEGHGLGMSISKKIVDLHGGKIWAESNFGHGCTVNFTLPKEV